MTPLFRSEVIDGRRARMCGEVAIIGAAAPWSVVIAVVGAFVAVGMLLGISTFARTESATGRLISTGTVSRIMPLRPGTITSLNVVDGQRVQAGQPLATIRVGLATVDRADPSAADLAALDAQSALTVQQVRLTEVERAIEIDKLKTSATQLAEQVSAVDSQILNAHEIAESSKTTLAQFATLLTKGFMSKIDFERRRQELLAQQASVAQLQGQRALLLSQLLDARQSLRQVEATTAVKVIDLKASEAALTERRIEAESARGYVLKSPVSGRVSGLQATNGGSVSPQQPLLTIIADNTPLIAELYAPSRARGLADVGQLVRLNYDAFPFDRYGSYLGRIASISPTVIDPADVDPGVEIKEPVYRIRVALERQTVMASGKSIKLQPGMTLGGVIVLERRSFLGWLLEPFYAVARKS